ncbi:MAG: hypothetical protein JWQ40_3216 [Segetibacter sp.]|jgi:hypothetical protein|nr:hypothetical protein [Segetibacter sp.]
MKKLLIGSALFIVLSACGGNSTEEATDANTTDSVGLTNPTAIDTTKHPSGLDNSNVISTDTAAMNTQNSINKAKAAEKKKK